MDEEGTYAFPRAKFDVLRVMAEVPATTSRLGRKLRIVSKATPRQTIAECNLLDLHQALENKGF